MKILNWKFRLNSANIEFLSYPTKLCDRHKFRCKNCFTVWWETLEWQLKHNECPSCRETVTYLIYFPTLNLYKVGFSTGFLARKESFGHTAETILFITYTCVEKARALEKQWLTNLDDYLVNTGELTSGNTETFKF